MKRITCWTRTGQEPRDYGLKSAYEHSQSHHSQILVWYAHTNWTDTDYSLLCHLPWLRAPVRHYFGSKFVPNANKIELKRNELAVDLNRQFHMYCKNEEHKYEVLVSLYHLQRPADNRAERHYMPATACSGSHRPKYGSREP
jgi:hypothetical protein